MLKLRISIPLLLSLLIAAAASHGVVSSQSGGEYDPELLGPLPPRAPVAPAPSTQAT